MKKTLTQRVKKIEKDIRQMSVILDSHGTDLYHLRNSDPKPYTAMRSTGECVRCGHNHEQDDFAACNCCNTLAPKYVKPQEDVRKRLKTYLTNNIGLNNNLEYIADSILAIVKGE